MKKTIVSTALILFSTAYFTIAQNAIGLRVGTQWNNVVAPAFNGTIDFKTMQSVQAGLVFELPVATNFSFQPEINYTEKGFRIQEATDVNLFERDVPVGVTAITRIQYIDVPLTGKYTFGTEGVRAYVYAGPSVGYALDGNLETRAKVIIDFKIASTPINLDNVNYKRFDIGGVAGAGVEFPVGNGKIFTDVRYQRGFKEVYEVPVVGAEVNNQNFGVSIGYKMNLGGGTSKPTRPRA